MASDADVGRADSAALLSDLDVLATQAWQTLGQRDTAEERELLAEAVAAHHGSAAYAIALRALWMNCPDALEVALDTVRKELLFLSQKLEFTRIRQQFVCLCRDFHMGCKDVSDGAALVMERCRRLADAQQEYKVHPSSAHEIYHAFLDLPCRFGHWCFPPCCFLSVQDSERFL